MEIAEPFPRNGLYTRGQPRGQFPAQVTDMGVNKVGYRNGFPYFGNDIFPRYYGRGGGGQGGKQIYFPGRQVRYHFTAKLHQPGIHADTKISEDFVTVPRNSALGPRQERVKPRRHTFDIKRNSFMAPRPRQDEFQYNAPGPGGPQKKRHRPRRGQAIGF